jgi:5' nucleotidase, deoxy (Pyrimidine), cytosolic type C protein (NT5C)
MQHGAQCAIITARNGNDPVKRKMTIEWVSYHFPDISLSDLHFVNHYSDESLPKSSVCKNLGITLLIDDHIDNARDMIDTGLSVILLEKPWNRDIIFDHPNLYRVKNWQEIINNLSSK